MHFVENTRKFVFFIALEILKILKNTNFLFSTKFIVFNDFDMFFKLARDGKNVNYIFRKIFDKTLSYHMIIRYFSEHSLSLTTTDFCGSARNLFYLVRAIYTRFLNILCKK